MRNTFELKGVKQYVEDRLYGDVLVPFAGNVRLEPNENVSSITHCDIQFESDKIDKKTGKTHGELFASGADFKCDAGNLDENPELKGKKFDVIVFDPPYSESKYTSKYKLKGQSMSVVTAAKNMAMKYLKPNGRVISFGYNSNGMGKMRGFTKSEVAVLGHGGLRKDTVIAVEEADTLDALEILKNVRNSPLENHADTFITVENYTMKPETRYKKEMNEKYGWKTDEYDVVKNSTYKKKPKAKAKPPIEERVKFTEKERKS